MTGFVGIYWGIPNPDHSWSILTDKSSLAEAEPYGDFLTHPRGHYDVWSGWQKLGNTALSKQGIPQAVAYHEYEGVALRDDEKPRLVRDLGDKSFLMLRNHGLITLAESVPDAFLFLYLFESACTIQVRAQAGGGELIPIHPRIIETAQAQAKQVTRGAGGSLAWPGLLRKLDRIDPSYRD